jgi:hypothetical protein
VVDGLGPTEDLERGGKGVPDPESLIMGRAQGNPSCLNCDEDGNWERVKRAFVTWNVNDYDSVALSLTLGLRVLVSQWEQTVWQRLVRLSPDPSRGPQLEVFETAAGGET